MARTDVVDVLVHDDSAEYWISGRLGFPKLISHVWYHGKWTRIWFQDGCYHVTKIKGVA